MSGLAAFSFDPTPSSSSSSSSFSPSPSPGSAAASALSLQPSPIYLGSDTSHATLLKSLRKPAVSTLLKTIPLLLPLLDGCKRHEARLVLQVYAHLLPGFLDHKDVRVTASSLEVVERSYSTVPKISAKLYEPHLTTLIKLTAHSSKAVKKSALSLLPLLSASHDCASAMSSHCLSSASSGSPDVDAFASLSNFKLPPTFYLESLRHERVATAMATQLLGLDADLSRPDYDSVMSNPGVSAGVRTAACVICYKKLGDRSAIDSALPDPSSPSELPLLLLSYAWKSGRRDDARFFGGRLQGSDAKAKGCLITDGFLPCDPADAASLRGGVWRVMTSALAEYLLEDYGRFLSVCVGQHFDAGTGGEAMEGSVKWRGEEGYLDKVVPFGWDFFKEKEWAREERRVRVLRGERKWEKLEGWMEMTFEEFKVVESQRKVLNRFWVEAALEEVKSGRWGGDLETTKKLKGDAVAEEYARHVTCRASLEHISAEWGDGIPVEVRARLGDVEDEGSARLAVDIAGPEDFWGVALKAERKWGGVEGKFWGSLHGFEDFAEWEEEVRKIALRADPEVVMREGGVGVWTQSQVREAVELGFETSHADLPLLLKALPQFREGQSAFSRGKEVKVVKVHRDDGGGGVYYTVLGEKGEKGVETLSRFRWEEVRPDAAWVKANTEKWTGLLLAAPSVVAGEVLTILCAAGGAFERRGIGSFHSDTLEKVKTLPVKSRVEVLKGMGGRLGVGWRKWWTDVSGWVNGALEELGDEGWSLWSDMCLWLDDAKVVGDRVDKWLGGGGDVVRGLEIATAVERARFRKGLVGGEVNNVGFLVDEYLRGGMKELASAASWVWSRGEEFVAYRRAVGAIAGERADELVDRMLQGDNFAYGILRLVPEREVDDDEFDGIRAKVEAMHPGYGLEEREEVEMGVLEAHKVLPEALREVVEEGGVDLQSAGEGVEGTVRALTGVVLSFLLCVELVSRMEGERRGNLLSYLQDCEGMAKLISFLGGVVDWELEGWQGCDEREGGGEGGEGGWEEFLGALSNEAFVRGLVVMPTVMKSWFGSCQRSLHQAALEFVERSAGRIVVEGEVKKILGASRALLGDMNVSGNVGTGEIWAKYMQDEVELAVCVRLPPGYPLRNPEVDAGGGLDAGGKGRKWGLALNCALAMGSAGILDCLLMWKENIDTEFDGVEPCPICYAVLDPKSRSTPNFSCPTCNHKFHRACLIKWFASREGEQKCVMCQQEINLNAGRRGRR